MRITEILAVTAKAWRLDPEHLDQTINYPKGMTMKFAKVFDVGQNDQILFWLTSNEKDEPEIQVITDIGGTRCRVRPTFVGEDRRHALMMAASNFKEITQSDADEFYEQMKSLVQDSEPKIIQ
ncbi:MAG: hypothetical protein CML16_03310 [Pusillimonas sp.]|nr:hypothetical protein [Pusillimonas sp.]MBC43616.1 hypothetical protein [Pusillimonas sp.]|tara:strand:- start:348 stop:716 length:369 start_codon:yes stop_codon:yes gene_type:complete